MVGIKVYDERKEESKVIFREIGMLFILIFKFLKYEILFWLVYLF